MECNLATKRDEVVIYATMCINLKNIVLKKTDTNTIYCMI